jgi:SAM-dependent methyltransferase
MIMDAVELREFYASKLGLAASHSIAMALSSIWNPSSDEIFLGLGFPLPWMDRFSTDAERSVAMMQAGQGALQWPSPSASATALVYDDELPLRDASVDRILMVHFLEQAESADECIGEAWRVLSPGGTLVIVIPNRRGVWARFEHTPFGTGRPYSRGQLNTLLRNNRFTPEKWSDALHFPPSKRDFVLRTRGGFERLGRRFWPVFSGVICVTATKRLFQGIPVTARAKRRAVMPVLVPQGTSRSNRDQA